MTELPIITHPDQATPEWLTAALTAGGHVEGTVTDVATKPVGTGQVGDSYRLTLTIDGTGPATLVGKFPSEDETSRAAASATRTYEIESRFYQQLRDRVDIRTPAPYVSLFEPETHDFVLLLEDMAPADQGDQIAGCDADTAALAMREIAKLHAPVWGDSSLESIPWLNRYDPEGVGVLGAMFGMFWPGWLERYGDRLEDGVVEIGETFTTNVMTFLTDRDGPQTAAHGDYRLDNMLFGPEVPLTTVDWQTVALGPGFADVAYFLGTSPPVDVRRAEADGLISEYHGALTAAGVDGVSVDDCRTGVRRYALAGFQMAVLASMLVGQTDRGDEMFMCMANRSARMAIDLDTVGLVLG